ncbi:hypothetical protein [Leucobacter musarum]|uniref:hypothetical protein n=1 Tax=Leucobacter musarum TaxID=1930747 RepID=UPI0006A786CF|nr:hypothetical protein [Leucobacter musarum]
MTTHPTLLPDEPERRSRPDTSLAALHTIGRRRAKLHAAIMHQLRVRGPLTDEQLVDAYLNAGNPPRSPQNLRTARSELARAGWIRDTGKRSTTALGNSARLWEVVPEHKTAPWPATPSS